MVIHTGNYFQVVKHTDNRGTSLVSDDIEPRMCHYENNYLLCLYNQLFMALDVFCVIKSQCNLYLIRTTLPRHQTGSQYISIKFTMMSGAVDNGH